MTKSSATEILLDLRVDGSSAADLFPVVYGELCSIAHRQLGRERKGHTLSTTALVHEAYLKLVDVNRVEWQDHVHFCAVAARAMRRILVDYARQRNAQKRGGKVQRITLDESVIVVDEQASLILSLDQALLRLHTMNNRVSQVVELRYFGGLSEEEAAQVLDVSERTVRRDWAKAKVWLFKELYPEQLTDQ